ncbi:MAG: carbohydrate ABC transporter permease [Sphaerochaeta sp.]
MTVRKNTIVDYILLFFFFLLVLFVLFPIFWMVTSAFKTSAEIIQPVPTVFPKNFVLDNFRKILTDKYFPRYFLNSITIACVVTLVAVLGSTLMGYVFAKFTFPLKNIFFYLILITIMIPFEATVVPLYLIVRSMKAINTYWGLIFPSIISSFGIFFMRQNLEQIPDSLIEAAKIDGAGNYFILGKIIFPLATSSISVLAVLLFLIEWSSYLWPLLIATKKEMFVLEIGLTLLQDEYITDYGIMMTGCLIALIPAMILFLIFRRNIMEGIVTTGIKG